MADGGEGTVEAAVAAGWRRVEVEVCGPTGRPVTARLALHGHSAVVELAEASGLRRLPGGKPRPLAASSLGTGQLIARAVRLGARRIVLGLGGGAHRRRRRARPGLGGRLLDALGRDLPPGGAALRSLHALDLRGLPDMSGIEVVVAGDSAGPLLGRNGAAAVDGPRRGATRDEVRVLDAGLRRWADLAEAAARRAARDLPGAGTSGGVGFAALTFLGATIEPGPALVLDLLGFAAKARGARLVVTGEAPSTPGRCAAPRRSAPPAPRPGRARRSSRWSAPRAHRRAAPQGADPGRVRAGRHRAGRGAPRPPGRATAGAADGRDRRRVASGPPVACNVPFTSVVEAVDGFTHCS